MIPRLMFGSFRRISGVMAAGIVLVVAGVFLISIRSTLLNRSAPRKSSTSPSEVRVATVPGAAAQRKAKEAFRHSSLPFEPNEGQTDPAAKFLARGAGYTVFFTQQSVLLRLANPDLKNRDSVLEMKLVGVRNAQLQGLQPLASRSHYYHGNSPKAWQAEVPHYGKVSYTGAYRDTDLIFYGRQGELEYDVVLGPGANPDDVVLQFSGARQLRVNGDGDLVLVLGKGHEILQHRPKIYQQYGVSKKLIAGSYQLLAGNRVRFEVGSYDRQKPLVIDPLLAYSSYLGGTGSGNDVANAIAVDSSGNAYIAGYTASTSFPAGQVGPIQANRSGGNDAFIASLSGDGSTLRYSTYLGGTADDYATGIALDTVGNAYITGYTYSFDFPATPGSYAHTQPANGTNAFVAKLSSTGANLIYATYLGTGTASGIAVDSSGNAYIAGTAVCCSFPTTAGAYQTQSSGYNDAFVTKLNSSGTGLVWSTLLGGSSSEEAQSIGLDSSLKVYIAGTTNSSNFPATPGALQSSLHGSSDAFVAKFTATGSALMYATYLGGSNYENANGIAIDTSGFAYVTGNTQSPDFPTTAGAYQTVFGCCQETFVAKINQTATALVYSTYLGSSGSGSSVAVDSGGNTYVAVSYGSVPVTNGAYNSCCGSYLTKLNSTGTGLVYSSQFPYSNLAALVLDAAGNAYIAGSTSNSSYPTTAGVFQPSFAGGNNDAIVTKLNASGSALVYSTYLGANGGDQGLGVTLDAGGDVYVTGSAGSLDFPITTEAAKSPSGPYTQTFVTKFNSSGTGLLYSTFVGGSGNDAGRAIAVDSQGSAYVTGQTNSVDFPITGSALQKTLGGAYDAFLYKLSSIGSLVYSTYLGGNGNDDGRSIAVDSSGNAYVAGSTASSNFITMATLGQPSSSNQNGFVSKINPTASGFLFSTVLGGSFGASQVNGLVVDAGGNSYIAGGTFASNFPVTNGAFQTIPQASQAAFVSKLNPTGNTFLYSTFLDGANADSASAIAVDGSGNAYVTGSTYSPNFPVTTGAFQQNLGGYQNAFVSKLNPNGSGLIYSTYLGGSGADSGNAIAVDLFGNVHVGGPTGSGNFPIVNGNTIMEVTTPYYYSFSSAFVSSLDASGATLRYSTYVGGATVNAISTQYIGGMTNIAVAGATSSTGLPGGAFGYQKTIASNATNAFVTKLQESSCLFNVAPTYFTFPPSGGTGAVNLTSLCPVANWVATPDSTGLVSFIPPTATSGNTSGAVNFSVPATFGAGSTAQFTVAGSIIHVTQTGTCGLTLPLTTATFAPTAINSASFTVNLSNQNCSWNSYTTTPWISITYNYGYGSGTVGYKLLPNPSSGARTGIIYVGDKQFTITQSGTGSAQAAINTPAPGSAFTDTSATFTWSQIVSADLYQVLVGNAIGASNYCNSGPVASAIYTCTNLPTDGSTVYVQLSTHAGGNWLTPNNYTYTAVKPSLAQLTNPAPVATYPGPVTTVLGGTSATFTWSRGFGADLYWLDVGTSYRSGNLCSGSTTALNSTCSALPCDGSTVYVQLWTHYQASGWQMPNNYEYLACSAATAILTSPPPNTTLAGSTVTFKWSAVAGADDYWLDIGTGVGQGNLCAGVTTNSQSTCANIPTNGVPIYAQLWTHINGTWLTPNRYTFAAAQLTQRAQLTSPLTPNLPGASTNFTWGAVAGADQYWLDVGNTVGQGNICASATAGASFTCPGIPLTAQISAPSPGSQLSTSATFCWANPTIYVQLWTHFPGTGWQTPVRYTFSSPLSDYWLDVGTALGVGNISAGVVSSSCKTVTLPTGQNTIYVQLWTRVPVGSGAWYGPIRYTYAAPIN